MTKRFTLALAIFIEAIMLAGCGQTQEIPTETVTEVQQELEEVVIEIPVENEEVINEEVIEEAAKEVPEGPVFSDKDLWDLEEWEYALINFEQDTDVEVWGNPYKDILYIKDGERVFSVDIFWGCRSAYIYKKDYNDDEVPEYLISVLTGTGTGVCTDDLYIISDVDTNPIATKYEIGPYIDELYQRITCDFEDDYLKTAKINIDGKHTTDVFLKSEVDQFGTYRGLVMGNFISYSYENDMPEMDIAVGFAYDNTIIPMYEASLYFRIPVLIDKDFNMTLGDIAVAVNYDGSYIDSMQNISDDYKKDCVEITTCYYDLIQNDIKEKITLWGQQSGDMIISKYISVYALDEEKKTYELMWEKTVDDSHYSIVKHNGFFFLLEVNDSQYNAAVPKYHQQYLIDSNSTQTDAFKMWEKEVIEKLN